MQYLEICFRSDLNDTFLIHPKQALHKMCRLETYLHAFPPGDDVLAVEEDLAGEVLADKEPELAPPVHHLAPVPPLLRPRVQLIDLALGRGAGRDHLGSRLEAALLLDWGGGHCVF